MPSNSCGARWRGTDHSADGLPVLCNRTILDTPSTDLAVVPALDDDVLTQMQRNRACIPWLKEIHQRGAEMASICTGAFLLAEAGLRDGRRATTHWASQRLFARRYPQVLLQDASIIVDEGSITTSGGATSFLNLIRQTAYAIFSTQKSHRDSAVLQAQQLMEDQPQADLSADHERRRLRGCSDFPAPVFAGYWNVAFPVSAALRPGLRRLIAARPQDSTFPASSGTPAPRCLPRGA